MSIVIASVMGILIIFAFGLVFMNRSSSEVVGAALPVAFGAFAALGLVFAFGKPAAIERVFPVVFVVQKADKYPIVIPYRPFPYLTLALFDQAVHANPKLLEDPRFSGLAGGRLFHHFLQKAIVDWLASRYFNTWRLRVERFQVGGEQESFGGAPDANEFAVKKLSREELRIALGSNIFAAIPDFGFGTLALPPRTSFVVQEPHHDSAQGEISEIRLKNWLCDVRIDTTFSMASVGLGAYSLIVAIPQQQEQQLFETVKFMVRIDATFSPYLKGHPQMAAHREWVNGIVEGLSHAFDEELIWRRTTESYLLHQHAAEPSKNLTILGPIRSGAPQP